MAEHANADGHGSHGPEDGHGHGPEGHGHGPHHGAGYYYRTYVVLVILLVLSVVGPFVGEATGLQIITLVTAFGIAFVKAGIVIRNFMHLNVEKAFVHYFLITSLAFMGLFFFAVAPDVMKHEGTRWKNVAAESWIERVHEEYKNGEPGHGGDSHGAPADHGDAEGHDAAPAEHH